VRMQNILILPIAAATCVATLIGGWVGISLRDRLHLVLAFSAGAVIGVAFFDLLPEAVELAASAGPHPQAEPMGLRAATVVGLEGALALAHGRSPGFSLHNRSTRVLARLHGRLNGAGEVHAKGTRRKRETLRGYAPTADLTKSGVACQVVQRGMPPLAILARTEVLWPAATLVSVPLLLWRGGTWLRRPRSRAPER